MRRPHFTRVSTLPALATAVREGVGERGLRRCFETLSLPPELAFRTGSVLPLRDFVGLFEQFARELGDGTFGVFAGRAFRPSNFGMLFDYSHNAPTLGEAIQRIVRCLPLHQGGSAMELGQHGGMVRWSYRVDDPLSFGRHHHSIHVLFQMHGAMIARFGVRPKLLEVGLEASAYGRGGRLEEAFGAPIRWSAETNYIAFDRAILDSVHRAEPVSGAPITFGDLKRYFISTPPVTARGKVETVLRGRLGNTEATLDGVADYLGVGARTLQRQLSGEGFVFRDLLERLRQDRAAELISETELSLGNIADLLGYSEQAHFTRAYRRWHGEPPKVARRRLMA